MFFLKENTMYINRYNLKIYIITKLRPHVVELYCLEEKTIIKVENTKLHYSSELNSLIQLPDSENSCFKDKQ